MPRPDERAGQVRAEGAADLERDVPHTHRLDRALMQYLRPDAGQLPQLFKAQRRDRLRLRDEVRVGGEDAGDVRPVFVDVRAERRGGQRACHIRAAAWERMDAAIRQCAVEARRDDLPSVGQRGQQGIGLLLAHLPVIVKAQPFRRVHKREAEQLRHQPRGQIFPARGEKVFLRAAVQPGIDLLQLPFERHVQAAAVANGEEPLAHAPPQLPTGHAVAQVRVAQI